jgi:ferredoxin, 2Fe-2S
MVEIVIENLFGKKIVAPDASRKVIELIHENYIDWMHACGKKGRCTTCKMIISSGSENLSSLTEKEENFMKSGRLNKGERLSCQAEIVSGELVISVAPENKFPHMTYSD